MSEQTLNTVVSVSGPILSVYGVCSALCTVCLQGASPGCQHTSANACQLRCGENFSNSTGWLPENGCTTRKTFLPLSSYIALLGYSENTPHGPKSLSPVLLKHIVPICSHHPDSVSCLATTQLHTLGQPFRHRCNQFSTHSNRNVLKCRIHSCLVLFECFASHSCHLSINVRPHVLNGRQVRAIPRLTFQ